MGFIFVHIVYKECFGQIWVKIKNDSLNLKVSILVLVSQIMVFHFVHFEYKKNFWQIFVKHIIYRVSLSSSWCNKNQFQLADLLIGRL